jgi:hypothetical protein
MKYFLGLEVAQSREEITISQKKYCIDLLNGSGLLGSRFNELISKYLQAIA